MPLLWVVQKTMGCYLINHDFIIPKPTGAKVINCFYHLLTHSSDNKLALTINQFGINHTSPITEHIPEININDQSQHNNNLELIKLARRGFTKFIESYISMILNSPLPIPTKIQLLEAKDPQGFPWLYIALHRGQYQAVKVYITAILNSSLSPKIKMQLLVAKSPRDCPGLFIALHKGHAQAIEVYITAVLDSSLTIPTKIQLLVAKSHRGCPGLYMALQNDHPQAIKVYITAILNSSLPIPTKTQLLVAKDPRGCPGLFIALLKTHPQAVTVYLTINLPGLAENIMATLDSVVQKILKDYLLAWFQKNKTSADNYPLLTAILSYQRSRYFRPPQTSSMKLLNDISNRF